MLYSTGETGELFIEKVVAVSGVVKSDVLSPEVINVVSDVVVLVAP
jgi:hypothetical protein